MGITVTLNAQGGRRRILEPGKQCDVPVAKLQKVLSGLPATRYFVRNDVMQLRLGVVVIAVGKDRWHAEHPVRNVDGFQADSHVHEPINLPIQEGFDGARVPRGVSLRIHDDGNEAAASGNIICPADDVAIEGADHYFVGQNADHA